MLEFAAMNEFQRAWILVWLYEGFLFLWLCSPVLKPAKAWSLLQNVVTPLMIFLYVLVKYKIENYIFLNIIWMILFGSSYLICFSGLKKRNTLWMAAVFAVCIELGRILIYGTIYITGGFDFYNSHQWLLRIIVQLLKLLFVWYCRKTVCEYAGQKVHMMDCLLIFIAIYHLVFMHYRRRISSSAANRSFEVQTFLMLGAGVVIVLYAMIYHIRHSMQQKHLTEIELSMQETYEKTQMKLKMDEEISRIYHDLKHQLAAMDLSELSVDKDRRKELADQLMDHVSQFEYVSDSGNTLLDSLLNHKIKATREKGITLELFMETENYDFLDSIDMCSIFGNILDNAIEAADRVRSGERRWIQIKSAVIQGVWILKAENSFSVPPLIENEKYISSKDGPKRNGIGISSIRYCVSKYGGKTEIFTEGNVFTIKVMVPVFA